MNLVEKIPNISQSELNRLYSKIFLALHPNVKSLRYKNPQIEELDKLIQEANTRYIELQLDVATTPDNTKVEPGIDVQIKSLRSALDFE
jgi:hypothetical protein